jgi:hypothetical protein
MLLKMINGNQILMKSNMVAGQQIGIKVAKFEE